MMALVEFCLIIGLLGGLLRKGNKHSYLTFRDKHMEFPFMCLFTDFPVCGPIMVFLCSE